MFKILLQYDIYFVKRIIFDDWQMHCRNSLGILNPSLYILPDTVFKHKTTRLNADHSDFNKIVLFRRKSKSVEDFHKISTISFESDNLRNSKNKTDTKTKKIGEDSNMKSTVKVQERSKSAFISKIYI